MLDLFFSGPQLSMGKQEAFETFIRDHGDYLTIEDNKNLLKQRLVTSGTSCSTVLINSPPDLAQNSDIFLFCNMSNVSSVLCGILYILYMAMCLESESL